MTDARAPHKAVCLLQVEVHELLPSGECAGRVVTSKELAEFGIKPKLVISCSGFDRQDCLRKLQKAINDFGKVSLEDSLW